MTEKAYEIQGEEGSGIYAARPDECPTPSCVQNIYWTFLRTNVLTLELLTHIAYTNSVRQRYLLLYNNNNTNLLGAANGITSIVVAVLEPIRSSPMLCEPSSNKQTKVLPPLLTPIVLCACLFWIQSSAFACSIVFLFSCHRSMAVIFCCQLLLPQSRALPSQRVLGFVCALM